MMKVSQDKKTVRPKKKNISVFDESSVSSSSSGSTADQIVKVPPQGKFRGKELLFQALLIKKTRTKKNQERLLPTAKNRTGKCASRVTGQCLYHEVFTTFLRHNLPEDLDLLKEIIKDIMTTLSLQQRCTTTPQSKLVSEVASWNTSRKATISVSSLVFEDNHGEDIRSENQDDIYGASNIVLPCPGRYVIFHILEDLVIILKSSI
jgi:hypothetical protein